jgi:hypothetical protein
MNTSMRVTVDLNQKFFNEKTFKTAVNLAIGLPASFLMTAWVTHTLSTHCASDYIWNVDCAADEVRFACYFSKVVKAIPCAVTTYKDTMGGLFVSTASICLLGIGAALYKNRVAILDLRKYLPLAKVKLEFVPQDKLETVQAISS